MKLSDHPEVIKKFSNQRLSVLWKDKMKIRERIGRNIRGLPQTDGVQGYKVSWDHPDYPKGTHTVEKSFKTREEAYQYAKHIARTVDLRREGVDDHALGVRTGYIPKPEPSSIVPIAIQTPFGMQELAEVDVYPELYDKNHLAKQSGNWVEPDKNKIRGL